MLSSWKLEREQAKPRPGRAQWTVTYTDPATGLLVRCDLTEYNDFPAVEWVLHIENRGSQDSPILERILPLDAEFKTAGQANVVVHHSVGEKNSWQSFAPVEDILAPGSKELVFAPIGGRSSDGQMPFFNLAYEPAYAFRCAMTAGNILASGNAQGRLSTADPDTDAAVRRTVAIYHKLRPYMVGDFYPLFPHTDSEEVWFGYQFHRSDLDAGAVILFRREKSKDAKMAVLLRAVAPKRAYEVSFEDTPETRKLSGTALSALPVEIPDAPGSAIVYTIHGVGCPAESWLPSDSPDIRRTYMGAAKHPAELRSPRRSRRC